MADKHLLPAERGIGGTAERESLPGRLIEEKPGDAQKRAAGMLAKIRGAQEAEGGDDGR